MEEGQGAQGAGKMAGKSPRNQRPPAGLERSERAHEALVVETSRIPKERVMRLNKSMMLGAVLMLAACGGTVQDTEYVEATPDLAGTSLEISGASDEGAALTAEDFSGA